MAAAYPFAAYGHALASLVLFAVLTMMVGPLAANAKAKAGVPSGAMPDPDYGSFVYRFNRAHLNAVEILGPFAALVLAAVLAGASAGWVNWLASIFLVSRLVHLAVHLGGWGRPDGGLRSVVFVVGVLCCVGLAAAALAAIFGGGA